MSNPNALETGWRAVAGLASAAIMALAASGALAQPPAPPTAPGNPQVQPTRPGGPQIQPPRPNPGGPQIQPPRPNPGGPRPPQPPRPGGPKPPYPPPQHRASVTLYSAPGYRGTSRSFSTSVNNLAHHGFNDHARSVRVAGVGRWSLCADANYRGRCITVTRSISDLRHNGLSGSVSSLRRQ